MALNPFDIQNIASQYGLGQLSQADINGYLQYANNGSVPMTSLDVGQMMMQSPTYQNAQLSRYGNQLQDMLGQSDQRIMNIAQGNLQQQFAEQGRGGGSSAYLNAFANAAANLAMSRQQAVAGFMGQGYGNIMDNSMGQANRAQDFGQSQQASTLGWGRQQDMMNRQMNFYNDMMNQQRRMQRNSALGGGIGAVLGGALGAMAAPAGGGAQGAMAGASMGGTFGGGLGGMF